MESEKFYIYTDASFNKSLGIAVAGWLAFRNLKDHQASTFSSEMIRTVNFKETNNIRAEIKGFILTLKEFSQGRRGGVNLYTDCQTITGLFERRDKLEASNFVSHQKKKVLPHADLYKEVFALSDLLHPEIHWVKGHSPKTKRSLEQRNFSIIDKIVRKELRSLFI